MATNLTIDPDLLNPALAVSGEQTRKATLTLALEEFIPPRDQRKILELFGMAQEQILQWFRGARPNAMQVAQRLGDSVADEAPLQHRHCVLEGNARSRASASPARSRSRRMARIVLSRADVAMYRAKRASGSTPVLA